MRVKEWTVMTDELLYAKLAEHIADTGSPLPVLHDQHVGFLGVVYPIVLAPFYGSLDPVAAFDAGHAVNVVLFASTAIPVFLLARRIVPRECALVVALLSIAIPWAVNTATLMSESAAYPAFAWAVLACHGALAEPSPRRDAVAIAALALAFFTRPQFLVLAALLPLGALVVDGPRRAFERHRVVAGACVVAVVVVVPLAALGEAHRLLGDYGVTATQGSLLPAGVWKSAAIHLDVVAVGLGVLPFLLGVGWTYSNLRSGPAPARAFAALAAFALPLLALETASYDLRFGGAGVIRDRYLFYLAPLLLCASAAALLGRLPLWGIVGAAAFFSVTVAFADFTPVRGVALDSAESVLNGVIHDESAGLPAGVFVAVCGVLLGAICVAFAWLPRPPVVLGVTVVLFAFCASVTGYAFERLLTSRTAAGLPVTGQSRVRDWVDRVEQGGTVGLVAYPISRDWGQSAIAWWDLEFWNKTVSRAYVAPNGRFTYTPFPARKIKIDFSDGRVDLGSNGPRYLLVAQSDSRLGLSGDQVATNVELELLLAEQPYRARWASRGLDPDGWTRPGRPALIRVFAGADHPTEMVAVSVTLDSPWEASGPAGYAIGGTSGSVEPRARAVAQVSVCVPARGHADVFLRSDRTARIAGPPYGPKPEPERDVGLDVSGVQTSSTGEACSP
jgi:Dolichyl-phosphate-mannose-protein mannosyltransferase